jgi:signal transduction histidine kinase
MKRIGRKSLKDQVLLMIGVGLVVTVATMLILTQFFIINTFYHLEETETGKNVLRVKNLISLEISRLDSVCREWSFREDTAEFIKNPDLNYIETHLKDEVFYGGDIDIMAFLDHNKNLIYWKALNNSLDSKAVLTSILENSNIDFVGGASGIMRVPGGIVVLSVNPVYNGNGVFTGSMLMVKYVDLEQIERISELAFIEAKIYDTFSDSLDPDIVQAAVELRSGKDVFVEPLGEEKIAGYTFVDSLDKRSNILLKIEMKRNIHLTAKAAVFSFIVIFVIIGITATVISIFHLSRNLGRINRLAQEVEEITEREDFDKKVSVAGDDEIAILADNINKMLERLYSTTKKLAESTDLLKLMNRILRHDLLNNLTIIAASLDLIKTGDKEFVDNCKIATERSIHLIQEMKALESNLLAGGELKPVDLREVIEKMVEDLGVDVNIEVEGECIALADEAISSVVDNIVKNALTHGKCTKIDIRIEEQSENCVLTIADDGKGIPDEIKEYIFDEGFKHGESANTGLGLFIVKKIVERYGGEITVEDNVPKGAVFKVILKRAE